MRSHKAVAIVIDVERRPPQVNDPASTEVTVQSKNKLNAWSGTFVQNSITLERKSLGISTGRPPLIAIQYGGGEMMDAA